MKNLLKIVVCTVLGVSTLLSGCEVYKSRQLTESEIRYKEKETRDLIQVPEHMKGTLLDPFPPARRGYDASELIKK